MKRLPKHVIRTILTLLLGVLAIYQFSSREKPYSEAEDPKPRAVSDYALTPGVIENSFSNEVSDVIVTEEGTIVKVLPDDTEGSRHQRFIVELSSGHTVLIAHNIDLAPRVPDLRKGEPIIFCGEYEWNKKGGVIHWTHHDPQGRHQDGWLEFRGNRYR